MGWITMSERNLQRILARWSTKQNGIYSVDFEYECAARLFSSCDHEAPSRKLLATL
jgi:hypothetical protein